MHAFYAEDHSRECGIPQNMNFNVVHSLKIFFKLILKEKLFMKFIRDTN